MWSYCAEVQTLQCKGAVTLAFPPEFFRNSEKKTFSIVYWWMKHSLQKQLPVSILNLNALARKSCSSRYLLKRMDFVWLTLIFDSHISFFVWYCIDHEKICISMLETKQLWSPLTFIVWTMDNISQNIFFYVLGVNYPFNMIHLSLFRNFIVG